MIQVDKEARGFRPTVKWMRQKYDEMNQELFGGSLRECHFDIFIKGKGSEGRRLGFFKMNCGYLKYDRYNRRMFRETYGDRVYINYNNFYEVCYPTISLNGNYTGTEYGFLSTLVHEMCHYYTYMNGRVPGKAHGPEFYHIGDAVVLRSGGLFTIERLASAEEMAHLDLNDEMKARQEKRLATKKSNIYAVFDYHSSTDIRLSTTSSEELIRQICDFEHRNKSSQQVIITNDSSVIDVLFENGYKKNFRKWKYWSVGDKDWLNILDNADKQIIKNPNRMNENKQKRNLDTIIKEAIDRLINEKVGEENAVEITADMDLGAYSPLEINSKYN
jgi:hypothetical protein